MVASSLRKVTSCDVALRFMLMIATQAKTSKFPERDSR
jgi:hypothetical protein